MFRLVVLIACLATAYGNNALSQCIHNDGDLPASVEFVGCSSAPCTVHQGDDVVINVKFNAPQDSTSLSAQLTVYVSIVNTVVSIPIDLGAKNQACSSLTNGDCPLTAGQDYEYSVNLHIDPLFPIGIALPMELRVSDDVTYPVFCVRSTIQVAAPRT